MHYMKYRVCTYILQERVDDNDMAGGKHEREEKQNLCLNVPLLKNVKMLT